MLLGLTTYPKFSNERIQIFQEDGVLHLMKLCEGLLPDCSVSEKKTGAKMTQAHAFATRTATYSATNKPMYAMSLTVTQPGYPVNVGMSWSVAFSEFLISLTVRSHG